MSVRCKRKERNEFRDRKKKRQRPEEKENLQQSQANKTSVETSKEEKEKEKQFGEAAEKGHKLCDIEGVWDDESISLYSKRSPRKWNLSQEIYKEETCINFESSTLIQFNSHTQYHAFVQKHNLDKTLLEPRAKANYQGGYVYHVKGLSVEQVLRGADGISTDAKKTEAACSAKNLYTELEESLRDKPESEWKKVKKYLRKLGKSDTSRNKPKLRMAFGRMYQFIHQVLAGQRDLASLNAFVDVSQDIENRKKHVKVDNFVDACNELCRALEAANVKHLCSQLETAVANRKGRCTSQKNSLTMLAWFAPAYMAGHTPCSLSSLDALNALFDVLLEPRCFVEELICRTASTVPELTLQKRKLTDVDRHKRTYQSVLVMRNSLWLTLKAFDDDPNQKDFEMVWGTKNQHDMRLLRVAASLKESALVYTFKCFDSETIYCCGQCQHETTPNGKRKGKESFFPLQDGDGKFVRCPRLFNLVCHVYASLTAIVTYKRTVPSQRQPMERETVERGFHAICALEQFARKVVTRRLASLGKTLNISSKQEYVLENRSSDSWKLFDSQGEPLCKFNIQRVSFSDSEKVFIRIKNGLCHFCDAADLPDLEDSDDNSIKDDPSTGAKIGEIFRLHRQMRNILDDMLAKAVNAPDTPAGQQTIEKCNAFFRNVLLMLEKNLQEVEGRLN